MINVSTKIHDKFSIEFKVGFSGQESSAVNDFAVNAWVFVPNSLDINPATYGKDSFYRDVKSNVRLITPDFSLSDIAQGDGIPLRNLRNAFQTFPALTEYEFHIKLFAAIFRSSLRDTFGQLQQTRDPQQIDSALDNIRQIFTQYRALEEQLLATPVPGRAASIFHYADEYMSHLATVQAVKLVRSLQADGHNHTAQAQLIAFIQDENAYKQILDYTRIQNGDDKSNQELIARHSLLRKYIDSSLYLKMETTEDGTTAQQLSFGMAAGIAMLISMLIALPFQKYLGSYPTLIFIVLVVAYMFKDRIKEWFRKQFAHRLKSKYYDNKTTIQFKNEQVGWIKESVDFISDTKTPCQVLALRNRSDLEADNALFQEKIIFYRKKVHVDSCTLRNHFEYRFSGINDILRLYVNNFTRKMDDPEIATDAIAADGTIQSFNTLRVYNLHIVLQFSYLNQSEYRAFNIALTRDGILSIDEKR